MDLAQIWEDIKSFFVNNYVNIIVFIATFFIGLIVVKIIVNISRRLLEKSKIEKITQNFILAIIKFLAYLVFLLVLLSIIGVAITGVIAAFSACVLAIGVALKDNIANLANGIIIVSTNMFKCGDFISIDGTDNVSGKVVKINFLFTTLLTTDNKKVTLPNNMIVTNAVTNYGANKTRRVDFTFSVAYESDIELVKSIVLDVMRSNGCVRLDLDAPSCKLKTMNASSLDFFAYCWVDNEDYWDVYYYVIENVFNEFKREGVSIPYNQLEVRMREDKVTMPVTGEKLPERVEKVREESFVIDFENDSLTTMLKKTRAQEEKLKKQRENKKKIKIEEKKQKQEKNKAKHENSNKTKKEAPKNEE